MERAEATGCALRARGVEVDGGPLRTCWSAPMPPPARGVDLIRARLLPEEKVAAVRELRTQYGSGAMIRDGVNDSPALAEANVGIAMGAAGSPAAIETADVALMADDLSRVPYAIRLSQMARKTVRFNIAVALGLKLSWRWARF